MSIEIKYDNYIFNDPIPLVSKNQEIINYGDRWGQITKINLQGQLTGSCPDDFMTLISGQNNLISGFSKDFKKLSISEKNTTIFEADSCIVRNINFDQSRYVKILNYSIDLDCYESNLFSGIYGVLDPVNEYIFTENEDKSITINHNVSARGINTSNGSALNNAKNYVMTLTGYDINVLPINISNSNYVPLLRSYTENINRLNGTYGVQEVYLVDISNNGYINPSYFTRYTLNASKSLTSDFNTISIQGSIQGAKTGNFADTRNYSQNLDLYSICQNTFDETLNSIPISLSFEENQAANLINFSASFDTDTIGATYFDYSVEINTDSITSISSVTISGPIKSRGNLKEKFENAKQFITTNIPISTYLYSLANGKYNSLKTVMGINTNFSLKDKVKNLSITESPEKGEISLSATFDDKDLPSSINIADASFEVTSNPTITLYRPRPTLVNGYYVVYDLGNATSIEKGNINVNTEFLANTTISNGLSNQTAIINTLKGNYFSSMHVENESHNPEYISNNFIKNISSSIGLSKQQSSSNTFVAGQVRIR